MKRVFLMVLAATGLFAQTAPVVDRTVDEKALSSISGQIQNSTNNEPVRKAKVTLAPGDMNKASLTATTDNDGKFAMERIEPGRYTLKAERQGFVNQNYGAAVPSRPGSTLDVKAGKEMPALNFKMTPQGIIAGRVLDDENEPMSGLSVTAMRSAYMFGKKRILPAGAPVQTNDLGEYRIPNLEPGKYVISSTAQKLMQIETGTEKASGKGFEEGFVPTYFPNVAESTAASSVEVAPGAEVRGIDIHLKKTRVVRVSGKLLNAQGEAVKSGVLMVYRREGGTMSVMPSSMYVVQGDKGTYELRNIAPGQYTLMAMSTADVQNMKITTANIEVADRPMTDRVITLGGGYDVPVTATYLNKSASDPKKNEKDDIGNVRVLLQQDENPMASLATIVLDKDLKGTMKTVNPDKYRFTAVGVPPGAYLKSATLGAQDVLANGLDIRNGVTGTVEVVIASPGAEVGGYVRNEKNEPIPGATVTLVPKMPNPHRGDLAKTVTADQNGMYRVGGIVPGVYNIYGWEEVESGAAEDPEFLKPYGKFKKEVSLEEGAKNTTDLLVILKAS